MKRFVVLAVLTALVAVPAVAQDHAAHAAPAPATAPAPAVASAAAAKFSLDTPVETLMADPAAKAVVETSLPDIATHERYDSFKTMTLNELAPMAPGKLTPDVLAKIRAGLAAIK